MANAHGYGLSDAPQSGYTSSAHLVGRTSESGGVASTPRDAVRRRVLDAQANDVQTTLARRRAASPLWAGTLPGLKVVRRSGDLDRELARSELEAIVENVDPASRPEEFEGFVDTVRTFLADSAGRPTIA